jgi:signal transduction histidine kinase
MGTFFTLLESQPSLDLPVGPIGWVGLLFFFIIIAILQWLLRGFNKPWGRSERVWFIALLIFTALTSLFLGVRLSPGGALPPVGIPVDPDGPTAMLLSAVPWTLAGGLLGPFPALLLALLSGVLRALWGTHNLFTIAELALIGTLFSAIVNQRYRTRFYGLIRHPLAAAIALALFYPLVNITSALFSTQGELVNRLDYAVTNLLAVSVAFGIELIIAGVIAEAVSFSMPNAWYGDEPLVPAPEERSLLTRFIYYLAPIALILMGILIASNWIVAGRAARGMLEERMSESTMLATENIPYFINTGQNLITQLANDPIMLSDNPTDIFIRLDEYSRMVAFFDQLILLDKDNHVIASYPDSDQSGDQAPLNEQMGFQMAMQGVPFQSFTIQPGMEQTTALASFMVTVPQEGAAERVLVGRSELGNNPMIQPIRNNLESAAGEGGVYMLVDQDNTILVHSNPGQVMGTYTGPSGDEPIFDEQYTAPDGTRRLLYYRPASGHSWAVVLQIPASEAQQLTLTIAKPLLWVVLILSLISVGLLTWRLRGITGSLKKLAEEAGRIAQGRLDHPMAVDGEDEVGQLSRAFERMRVSLKARLDELNRLLIVSQGVASSLELSETVQPVLEAALATGASAARAVITPMVMPELDGAISAPISFGLGPSHNLYQGLDDQILAFTRQQDRLVLASLTRPRLLSLPPGAPNPASLMAVALRHENTYYGTLWIAHDEPHNFTEEEVRFVVTLGGYAAMAAANARLFLKAEVGRQQLAAILASSPDPILVIDQRDQLLVANPAAWQALALGADIKKGQTIDKLINQEELLDLLRSPSDDKMSKEMILPDGRIYLASTTPVVAEGQRVGRVCIMQDVTHFKELDSLKSEFVSTVSHDLRSPLTLMRGYTTMLEMVGQLNEQQVNYVRKIVSGVESMSRLVNNLLDLGRIEAGIGLQLEMTPVYDVIERVVSALQLQAAQKRIQLTTEIPKHTAPMIEADPALLQQALHNLVENAIKYTEQGGKVMVRAHNEAQGIVFEIIDTGIGISPMDQQRLFEKFYRGAGGSSGEQEGTGLGLAIVKSIAERHGGRVWAESKLGKGSAFYLAIPFRQPLHDSQR